MSRSNNLDDVIYEPTGPFLLTDATFYATSAPQKERHNQTNLYLARHRPPPRRAEAFGTEVAPY